MPSDPVDAELAAIRERSDEPLGPDYLPLNDATRRLMQSAADVPRLLAAVQAVVANHQPFESRGLLYCDCCGSSGNNGLWPCPTYRAISAALLGEDA